MLYGFYNTAQKLIYSKGSKDNKIKTLNNWLNNTTIKTSINENFIDYINKNSNKQLKVAYSYIINEQLNKLYYMLKIKQIINPMLQVIKNIIKGNVKQYDVNKPNR